MTAKKNRPQTSPLELIESDQPETEEEESARRQMTGCFFLLESQALAKGTTLEDSGYPICEQCLKTLLERRKGLVAEWAKGIQPGDKFLQTSFAPKPFSPGGLSYGEALSPVVFGLHGHHPHMTLGLHIHARERFGGEPGAPVLERSVSACKDEAHSAVRLSPEQWEAFKAVGWPTDESTVTDILGRSTSAGEDHGVAGLIACLDPLRDIRLRARGEQKVAEQAGCAS